MLHSLVWGWTNALGMGDMYISEGNIMAEQYIQTLAQHMLRTRQHHTQKWLCLFQQDIVRLYSAHITTKWLLV